MFSFSNQPRLLSSTVRQIRKGHPLLPFRPSIPFPFHSSTPFVSFLNLSTSFSSSSSFFSSSSSSSTYSYSSNSSNKKSFHSIVRPSHYEENLITYLTNPELFFGKQIHGFTKLQELLKGLRPGELTVFSGPTGSGKTTFLSQYSLNLAESGVSTLWGSFEVPNHTIIRKMICQLHKTPFTEFTTESLQTALKDLNNLPIYFMPYFGTTRIDAIIKLMHQAKKAYNVEHVILDNLQFFLSGQANSSIEKLHLQDGVIHELRQFATEQKVHITIVVHPRKENLAKLTMDSVSGTAKVTQEADNVILLQRKSDPCIELVKNRFDGTLGKVSLNFNKHIGVYEELNETRQSYVSNTDYGDPYVDL